MNRNSKNICELVVVIILLGSNVGAEEEAAPEVSNESLPIAEQVQQGFGIGLVVGEPTGLSAKKWLSETTAIDGALAWSFSGRNSFQIHADYLWHNFDIIKPEDPKGQTAVYYGVGARVKLKEDDNNNNGRDDATKVGIRVPVGLTYVFPEVPVDLFAEIVPILNVAPDTDLDLGAAVGVRYYFR